MASQLPHADQRPIHGDIRGSVVVERCSLEAVKPCPGVAGGPPGYATESVRGQVGEEFGEVASGAGGVGPGQARLKLLGLEPTLRKMVAQCARGALPVLI